MALCWIYVYTYGYTHILVSNSFLDLFETVIMYTIYIIPILFILILISLLANYKRLSGHKKNYLIIFAVLVLSMNLVVSHYNRNEIMNDGNFYIVEKECIHNQHLIYVQYDKMPNLKEKLKCSKDDYKSILLHHTYYIVYRGNRLRKNNNLIISYTRPN